MKWLVLVLGLAGAGFLSVRHWALIRTEELIVASVCAEELTAELQVMQNMTEQAMKDDNRVVGGALAFKRKALYEGSSLGPHLTKINLAGEPPLARIKALAKVASARCPEAFPEPIKAEKPIGLTWLLAFELPD
jgi:hypothetical protein